MYSGIENFIKKFTGKEEAKKTEEKKALTEAEKKQIKEGGEAVNELENSMDLGKIAEELQKTDKDLRTDFSKQEEKKE